MPHGGASDWRKRERERERERERVWVRAEKVRKWVMRGESRCGGEKDREEDRTAGTEGGEKEKRERERERERDIY